VTIEEISNGLDWLSYDAERSGFPEKEKVLYAAATALRAAHTMRHAETTLDLQGAHDAWDATVGENK
jgi:hypothetical protein